MCKDSIISALIALVIFLGAMVFATPFIYDDNVPSQEVFVEKVIVDTQALVSGEYVLIAFDEMTPSDSFSIYVWAGTGTILGFSILVCFLSQTR